MNSTPLKQFSHVTLLAAGIVIAGVIAAPAAGPGLGNLTYPASDLNKRIGIINDSNPSGTTGPGDGHGNVSMHDGYLVTIFTEDGGGQKGGFAFWNVSNPRSPVRFANHRPSNSKLREPHGFGFTTGFSNKKYFIGQSTSGIQIWDWTDVQNPILVRDIVLSGANSSDYGGVWWVAVQAPYIYVAGGDAGLYVVDITNPTSPVVVRRTNAQLGISRLNQIHVIGNLAVGQRIEGGSSVLLMDVSDPMNPSVKLTIDNTQNSYSGLLDRGKLWLAGKGNNKLFAYNITFDANNFPNGLTSAGSVGTGLGEGGYLSVQDGFVFAGFSQQNAKFDTRTSFSQVATCDPNVDGDEDLDFGVVLGNIVFAGDDHGNGSGLWVHQTAPDTTGPTVNFVSPRNNAVQQNIKSRIGVTFSDGIDIRSLSNTTFIVRPVGGAALAGKYSLSGNHIVNFAPNSPLATNTTYEVVVPVGGVKDFVGNTVPTQFTSTFSTGPTISSAPTLCNLGTDTPRNVGASVPFSVTACTGTGLTYSWNFGDGTPPTAFSSNNSTSHVYTAAGHYNVILTAKASSGQTATFNRRQTIIFPVTATAPARSSTIVHDSGRGRISVVNSDANTVASLNAASPFAKVWEMPVGKNPRSLALTAPGGSLWVVNQNDANISVLDGNTGATTATIPLRRASRPNGIAIDPAGAFAYVALEGSGELVKISVSTRSIAGTVAVGRTPRQVAVSADGSRVFVTRFISPDSGGEVREVSASAFTVTRTLVLARDTTTQSSESDGPGLPNYVQGITITPDGRGAWVASKKDNIGRGIGPTSDGVRLDFESTVRTIISKLDLVNNTEVFANRRDINDSDLANATVFNSLGDFAFVLNQGNNHIEVFDALDHNNIGSIDNVGLAPQGLILVNNNLFIQNSLSRDVSIYNVASAGTSNQFTKIGSSISTQSTEPLSAQVLLGKRIFHNAADPRMSLDSYISCSSCHLEGDTDGRTWDFTQRGEGVRNTVALVGRAGVNQQGPVHWTGNFDEIQDFENDIRGEFGGDGFMTDANFNASSNTLGAAKAGRSADLDALAAYVSSLTKANPSPYRNTDGTLTADALAGRTLFFSSGVGCASCHSGSQATDSSLNTLHNVGTITAASGKRMGQTLTGFDTPTILGGWESGPYLHDGSAATFMDVLTTRNPGDLHGNTSQLTTTEKNQLVAFLLQADSPADLPVTATPVFSPPPGTYPPPSVDVTITCSTPGSSIRYTTDGTTPTSSSGTPYTGPVTISSTTTLKAIAFASGLGDSSVTSGTYIISAGPTITQEAEHLSRTSTGATTALQNDVNSSGGVWVALQADGAGDLVNYTLTNVPAGTYSLSMKYKGHPNRGILQLSVNGTNLGATLDQYSATSIYPEQTFGNVTFASSGNQTVRLTVTGRNPAAGAFTLSADFFKLIPQAGGGQVATPTFNPPGGTYTGPQSVTISTTTSGATIRYTTDGSTPTSSSTLYTGPVAINSSTTLKAVGFKSGMTDSAVAMALYVINLPQVAAPTFSPPAGTYTNAQSVTISTTTGGASIRYTVNGTDPTSTTGTLYSGPVSISVTTTLKAIAFASGMADSAVTSGLYTINSGVTPLFFEAENLARTTNGAVAALQSDVNTSGGAWIALQADGTGDWIQYTLPNVPAGTYNLGMLYKAHPNRGILSATVDGIAVPGTLDQYSATPQYLEADFGGWTFNTTTNHLVRLTVTGRNPSAGAFTLSSDAFALDVPSTPTVAMEAESLARTSSGAVMSTNNDAGASGGVWIGLSAAAAGPFMTLTTPSLPAGTYSLQFTYKLNNNRGQHTVQVDGVQVGGTIDQYNATAGFSTVTLGNVTFSSAGTHTIRLTVTGKTAASSNFTVSADKITFVGQ